MKVLFISFCFRPDPIGGTELYVEALGRSLKVLNIKSVIAAPSSRNEAYYCDNIPVRRFQVAAGSQVILDELYGAGDPVAAANFATILDEEQPDIVHMHAFTRAASLRLVREAKLRRLPIIFTYHTPTVSCQRGTLMRWGREVCDGRLKLKDCTSCALHHHGLSKGQSMMLAMLPPRVGNLISRASLSSGLWTALRMSELVQLRHNAVHELMAEVDRIIALCDWTRTLLLCNGIPPEKITLSHHGLAHVNDIDHQIAAARISQPKVLRIAFLGRIDDTKGVDVVIRAFRALPELNAQLDVYGVVQSAMGNDYLRELRIIAADDSRINFRSPIRSDQVISSLREYDVLAVPSRIFETGPLVVLEAFAAGIPVIGSNLGGIAELIQHEVNGLLVETDSITEWKAALQRCASEHGLLDRLRAGIRPPKSMDIVAEEMLTVYESLLTARKPAQAIAH